MVLTVSAGKTWMPRAHRAWFALVLLALVAAFKASPLAQSNDLTVQFTPSAGTFVERETVRLSVRGPADIHYTLDGSLPTARSPVYREPLTLDTSTRLRAMAIAPGAPLREGAADEVGLEGPIATEIYLRIDKDTQRFSSHLPVILIHTFESGALNVFGSEHAPAALLVMEPSPSTGSIVGRAVLDTRIGIHVRGQSSRGFPKKQYAIEFRADGDDTDRDQPLLGLPSQSDWVLSDPVTYDRSLVRNALAYALSNRIGRYAPRTRFAEVFMTGGQGDIRAQDFLGFFTLIEKIDRDANRVDVRRLPESASTLPDISGGFIVSIDKGGGDFAAAGRWMQFVYPSPADMARPERRPQLDFIRSFIDNFGQAVASPTFRHPATGQHYSEFIDVDTFIDHHIINVLAKNPDGMTYSTYFHKDRGGRLVAGPVWDFDRTFGTPYDQRATAPEEWAATWGRGNAGGAFTQGWWWYLFRDPDFTARYQARFKALLSSEFAADNLDRIVDGLVAEVGDAAERNFRRWTWSPPLGNSHAAEIAQLKDFLRRRVAWIAAQLDSNF
jgi:hypothetical protein